MSFDAVVFAGGGSRCFWQVGFYAELHQRVGLQPRVVSAVSAGAAMACMAVTGRWRQGLAHFLEATRINERNFYPDRLLTDRPSFPHLEMYRTAILSVIDRDAFTQLQDGPDVHILLARAPRWLGPRMGAAVAFASYMLERHTVGPVHPQWNRRLGFHPEVARAQDCASRDELADLILHSSCTPPLTPLYQRNGRSVLDGGAVDPVPTLALRGTVGRTLILLTSRYRASRMPDVEGRVYVQPSVPIPVTKWDYAHPERIQRAYDLGRRDARAFLQVSVH